MKPSHQDDDILFDRLWADDEAEAAAEEFVLQITSAEDVAETARDEVYFEELARDLSQAFDDEL